MNSPESPTEPTVIVGLPVNLFAQPAKFRSEPSNSGCQNRRCEQWKMSTPASASGVSQVAISSGVRASFTAKSCCFHCERRRITAKSVPTAERTARTTSTAKRLRSGKVTPP